MLTLLFTGDELMTSANDYKNYRESVSGGGYNVVLLDQEELWMQFGGGVPKHPFGIRYMTQYAYEKCNEQTAIFILARKRN